MCQILPKEFWKNGWIFVNVLRLRVLLRYWGLLKCVLPPHLVSWWSTIVYNAYKDQNTQPAQTLPNKLVFSSAAATRSLSFNCLFTVVRGSVQETKIPANSFEWVPGEINMSSLKRSGSERSNLTLRNNPINVAIEPKEWTRVSRAEQGQWGMVGVKRMVIIEFLLSTSMSWDLTTLSCSKVRGCSGSLILRIISWGKWTQNIQRNPN